MAEEKGMATMKIEDIRTIERFMFWFERAAIFIGLVLPGTRYLFALLFLITNTVFIALSVERQFIRRFFFEPDAIFYLERLAILLVILHNVVPGGSANSAIVGMAVLLFTNCWMFNPYVEEQLRKKGCLSSETNTNQNAKETRMGDHDQEEKNEKAIIKDESLKKKGENEISLEAVALFEAFIGGSFEPAMSSITKKHKWIFRYLPFWDFLNREEKKALWMSFWESLDSEEKVLLMNCNPRFESNSSSNAMETINNGNLKKEEAVVEDQCLKEKSEVNVKTINSVDAISECDSVHIKEELGGHGEELKTEEDESLDLQRNNTNISASEDAKTEKDVQEQWSAVSLTDDIEENEDDLKEEEDETEGSSDLEVETEGSSDLEVETEGSSDIEVETEGSSDFESDNQSWVKVQNDLSESLSELIESSLDQQKTDEVEEAKDEQAATGNYKSESDCDCDCSWVQNILSGKLGAEIAPSDQKKADRLEEVEHKENTSYYNSDESSWEEGPNSLSRKSSASISSSEFVQEQMHEYEVNFQEKKDLPELPKQIVEIEVIVEDEHKSKLGLESCNPNVKLEAAMEILAFAEECHKWKKEKEQLQAKLDAVTESLEQERRKWQDEKKELYARLDVSLKTCETYKANETGFAEERQKWELEKNALKAVISHTNDNVQYGQTIVNAYNELCLKHVKESHERHSLFQDSFNQLMAERDSLSSWLEAATSSAESYKAWYIQSEQHCQYYKACFEEYEGKYSKLMEDHQNLSSKLYSESSFAEHYKKVAQELEDKCSRLEDEKTDLTAKLCAAKASSELYRSCLHDFVA